MPGKDTYKMFVDLRFGYNKQTEEKLRCIGSYCCKLADKLAEIDRRYSEEGEE